MLFVNSIAPYEGLAPTLFDGKYEESFFSRNQASFSNSKAPT